MTTRAPEDSSRRGNYGLARPSTCCADSAESAQQPDVRREGLRLETVAHARFGQQMVGMRRIVLEFASQLRQIHAQVMGLGGIRRSPHFFEEFLAADQLAAIADQYLEHAPFGWRSEERRV